MSGRRLVLWRHGRTAWNAGARFQGQIDVPLDEVGQEQARRAAPLLASMGPVLLLSSDLSRAAETAGALASVSGLDVVAEPGLRETYAGQWQSLERAEIEERFGASWAAWIDGDDTLRPGGDGELRTEVADRVVAALEERLRDVPDGATVVATTHGGAARAAIGRLLGLPVENWAALGVLSNCAWSVLAERPDGGLGGASRGGSGGGLDGGSSRGGAGAGRAGTSLVGRWRLVEYNAGSLPEPALGDDR